MSMRKIDPNKKGDPRGPPIQLLLTRLDPDLEAHPDNRQDRESSEYHHSNSSAL